MQRPALQNPAATHRLRLGCLTAGRLAPASRRNSDWGLRRRAHAWQAKSRRPPMLRPCRRSRAATAPRHGPGPPAARRRRRQQTCRSGHRAARALRRTAGRRAGRGRRRQLAPRPALWRTRLTGGRAMRWRRSWPRSARARPRTTSFWSCARTAAGAGVGGQTRCAARTWTSQGRHRQLARRSPLLRPSGTARRARPRPVAGLRGP